MMQALACCLLLVEPSWAFGLGSHQPQAVVRAAQLSARAMAAPVASLPELKNDLMVRMARGARQEGGTGFGQLALRRLLSAPCLRLLLAPGSQPASQPLRPCCPAMSGVFSTQARDEQHAQLLSDICALEGSLHDFCFAGGLQRFGLQRGSDDRGRGGTWYREWAPAASAASLVGDFNNWDARAHPCGRAEDGVFEVFVPDQPDGSPGLPCGSRYKVRLKLRAHGGDDTSGGGGAGGGGGGAGACGVWEDGDVTVGGEVWEDRVPAWAKQTVQEQASGYFVAV